MACPAGRLLAFSPAGAFPHSMPLEVEDMKFTVIGGDGRIVQLVEMLRRDGHRVSPYALERELICSAAPDFDGSDGVILPLPAEKNGALFAPFSDKKQDFSTIFAEIPPKTRVFAGKASHGLRGLCAEKGLILHDYFLREDFTLRNARLTAEGAISLLMSAAPQALLGRRVLIYGFGRIGRALARRLLALETKVTVCVRDPLQRMEARMLGCADADFSARPEADYVLNTVPLPHLSAEEFPGCICLELASPPYGFEPGSIGSAVMDGAALPGRYAPRSAAEAIRDTIYNILEEEI